MCALSACLSCPVCLPVTLMYCGQTVGWIKMPLSMEVGLAPGDIVLHGDAAGPGKGAQQPPTFRPTLLWHGRPSATAELLIFSGSKFLHSRCSFPSLFVPLPFRQAAAQIHLPTASSARGEPRLKMPCLCFQPKSDNNSFEFVL